MTSISSNTECEQTSASSSSKSPPAKQRKLIDANIWNRQYFQFKTREIKFNHLWIINNMSYHLLQGDLNHVLYSSVFSSPKDDKLKMSLKLSLHDSDEEKKFKYFLNLRINNCDREEELALRYTISILKSDGNVAQIFSSKQKISRNYGLIFDCSKFCLFTLGHLNPPTKYFPGDVLTIHVEICYGEVVGEKHNSSDSNKIALAHLQNDCVQLLQNSKESYDVELVFGKGKKKINLTAHKAILGARSEVFAAMFDHDMREKSTNRVEMKDVDAEMGKVLLDYFYGQIPDMHKYAEKLLPIADKYQLHSLKSICEGALCFGINPESVGNLLLLADMHNAALLKSKCIEYIHCYANCVVKKENMKDPVQSRPELCYELFNHIPQAPISSWSPPTNTFDPNLSSWSYTGSRVLKCSQSWTIDNFNANYLSINDGQDDFIESPSIPIAKSNNNSVQFDFVLHPHGTNDGCKDHLSLYTYLKGNQKIKVALKQTFSIVSNENSKKGDSEKEYELSQNCIILEGSDGGYGWGKFISHKELMENNELMLKNDRFVIFCEMSYIENIGKETKSGLNTFAHEHEFSIARDLAKFYTSQKLTDAVFVIGPNELKVHKTIVSSRSEVFAKMFENTNRVQMDDVDDVDAFERMLALIYGQTEVLTQWAHKILPLVDKFEINSLKQVSQLSLCNQLSETNAVEYLMLADKHKANLLKNKAIELIRSKQSVLKQNDALQVLKQDNPDLFYEMLCYKLVNSWNE